MKIPPRFSFFIHHVRWLLLFAIFLSLAIYLYAQRNDLFTRLQPPAQAVVGTLNIDSSTGGSQYFNTVGIGTTNPTAPLTVAGAVSSTAAPILYLQQSALNYGYEFRIDNTSTGNMYLRRKEQGADAELLQTWDANGNVGIGTTNPGYKLDVNGTSIFRGAVNFGGQNLSSINGLSSGRITVGDNYPAIDVTSGGLRVQSGDVDMAGVNLYLGSDMRFYQSSNWLYLYNDAGAYSDKGWAASRFWADSLIYIGGYSIYPAQSSYGTLSLGSPKNGYYGMQMGSATGSPNWMYDGSGNGGLYFQGGNGWAVYYIVSNAHWNFGTSSDLGYSLGVSGNLRATSTIYSDASIQAAGAVYASDWFRAYGTTGLYSQTYDMHIWPLDSNSNYWGSKSNYGWRYQDRNGYNKGYLYFAGGNFGLLSADGNWGVAVNDGRYVMLGGEVYPGRPDSRGTLQSSYYLAGNYAGYGLYTNTSFRAGGAIYSDDWISAGNGIWSTAGFVNNKGGICFATNPSGYYKCWVAYTSTDSYIYAYGWNGGGYQNVAANSFWTISDARIKKNIESIPNALNIVSQLKGRSFQYTEKANSRGKGRHFGFVAQEVEQLIPEAIAVAGDGYKGITYDEILPFAIEAIKQINDVVDVSEATSLKSPAIKIDASGISHVLGIIVGRIEATLIETKKLIVSGVDVLERLNALTRENQDQQKELDELKLQIRQLRRNENEVPNLKP